MSQASWDALKNRTDRMATPPVNSVSALGICGGRIGSGGTVGDAKFCTLPCLPGRATCRFTTHSQKATIHVPGYYICTPKNGSAFASPYVMEPDGGFSALQNDTMTGTRPMREWNDIFTVLNGFTEDMSESSKVENITKVSRQVTMGLTPHKNRNRRDSEELEEDMLNIAESESWGEGRVWNLPSQLIKESMGPDQEFMEHIHGAWNFLLTSVIGQKDDIGDIDRSLRNIIEEIDIKILRATAAIGIPSEEAPALTLWNCVKEHSQLMKGISDHVSKLKNDSIADNNILGLKVAALQSKIDDQLLPILTGLTDKFEEFSDRIPSINQLVIRLERCEEEIQSLRSVGAVSPGNTHQGQVIVDNGELVLQVGDMKDQMAGLKREFGKIRNELNTEAITSGGFTFQSPDSYVEFIKTHVPSNHWGFCYDFISIFELQNDQNRTSDDSLQSNHLVGKVGYKDLQSARIDNSFKTLIPAVFGAEQDPRDPSKKMGRLVSMDIWDHPTSQSGIKEDIKVFFDTNASSLFMQIESTFGNGTRAALFFEGLITQVIAFWNSLDAWITRFEKDLTAQAGGDNPKVHKESVWKLICWMLHAMFKEMAKRRQPGSKIPSFSSGAVRSDDELQQKCASILHGTLSAHKFMKELMNDGFVRHPIFSSTMDEYLLKNKAAHVSMVELQTKVTAMDSRLKGAQAAIDRFMGEKKKGPAPVVPK